MSDNKSDDNKKANAPVELSNEKLENVQGGITLDNGIKMKRDVPAGAITLDNGIKMKRDLPTGRAPGKND